MGKTIAEKIIEKHLVEGRLKAGEEIGLRIDQTLTQDATGTMAYLEFEAMGIARVKTELSVAYVDHNTLQCGYENADDHLYLKTVTAKHGIRFSRAGNGICHQVHLERFGIPAKTLVGSDSHTPTAGGLGMLAFGAGGMDVAVAMGGGAYHIVMPKMIKVELTGRLQPFVSAKDVALELLRLISVKGGVGAVIEWGGEGVKTLSVPERATIANMGTETGATASIFPSDENTLAFLKAQGRERDFLPLASDPDAVYDRVIRIDLSALEPLIACPHSPDRVVSVRSLSGKRVDQVCVGSCTNSSYSDLMKVAAILKGKRVDDGVSMSVSPGSKQVLTMLSESGGLVDLLAAGARLLECACGPCIGMGFSPNSAGVSVRTFNRNFLGRSGTKDAEVYLASPETCAACALFGKITDPRTLHAIGEIPLPVRYPIDDGGIVLPLPPAAAESAVVVRGPNIKPFPSTKPLPDRIEATVSLKTENDVTTDHIMPAGAKILPYRSNIPYLTRFCFSVIDEGFAERARALESSVIVGGENYGQGSSREHAALVPRYLGVRAVIAKSFARIHEANLVNAGILPLTFARAEDYDELMAGDAIVLDDLHRALSTGSVTLTNGRTGRKYVLKCRVTERGKNILLAGGLIAYTARGAEEKHG